MQELNKTLSKGRKKREFPGLAPVAEVKRFACAGSHPIHQSTAPGILCIDIHKTDDNRILTGGVDNQVILFDAEKDKLVQKMLGHSKKVSSVALHPTQNVALSASQDASARVWACTDTSNWKAPYQCASVVRKHKGEVTDLSIHPLGDFFTTSSLDKSWALHDLGTGRCVFHIQDLPSSQTCMKIHPDGMIIAGGTEDNIVNVWDIKDQKVVAELKGHEGAITQLSFSNNGYYLATSSRDGTVKLWDLRKPLNIQTLKVSEDGPANCVSFDQTGQYLSVGGNSVQVFNFETKTTLASTVEIPDHGAAVMGLCFGSCARTLASVSMDRTLKIYKIK